MSPRVTVLVVTWNSRNLIPSMLPTLRSLQPHCRMLISDNASTDGTPEILKKELEDALVISNPRNGGFGYGNNMGLKYCDTEYLLLLNADASIGPEGLCSLVSVLDGDRSLTGVQPIIRHWEWPLITLSAGCSMTELGSGYDMDFMHFKPFAGVRPVKVPAITAAVSLFRTCSIKEVGGFDERMFMYFEDLDLCLRMASAGGAFALVPSVSARHMLGFSSNRREADVWELTSSAYLARKYLGGPGCILPDYWRNAERKARLHALRRGRAWLWRMSAIRRAKEMAVEHVELDPEFTAWLLAPRPLRMPNPRTDADRDQDYSAGGGVMLGPGWSGMKIGTCGFGCLKLPVRGGRLAVRLGAGNIPGSVSLWCNRGHIERVSAPATGGCVISACLPRDVDRVYVVPDCYGQVLELESTDYAQE